MHTAVIAVGKRYRRFFVALAIAALVVGGAGSYLSAQTSTFFSLPDACVQAGITTPEECKRFFEEQAASQDSTHEEFALPTDCTEAGITSVEECKTFFESRSRIEAAPVEASSSQATVQPDVSTAVSCTEQCAAKKSECVAGAAGVASALDACSLAAGACYQSCSTGETAADASGEVCIKDRCYAVTKQCMGETGDDPAALASCEKRIGECVSVCIHGGQPLNATECTRLTCGLVEGRCMAGDAGSFSEASIAVAGGRIGRCVQAGSDCRTRCAGGSVSFGQPLSGLPEPCRLKNLPADECRAYMASLFSHSTSDMGEAHDFEDGIPVDFSAFLPQPCVEQGITDPASCADAMRRFSVVSLPKDCVAAGIDEPDACQAFFERKALLPECAEKGASTIEECKAIIVARNLPKDCADAGVYDEAGCRALVQTTYLPKTCRDAGITDERSCEKAVFDKYGRPEECVGIDDASCRRLVESGKAGDEFLKKVEANELPQACADAGASSFDECDDLTRERTMPAECREASVFTPEGCEKYLYEKYRKLGEERVKLSLPTECREEGISDAEGCRTFMEAKFFPKECVESGVTDSQGCRDLLALRHLPKECRDRGITTQEECEQHLRESYLLPVCAAQGITDQASCEEFAHSQLANAVECRGVGQAECALALKERHLGTILGAQRRLDGIESDFRKATAEDGTLTLRAVTGEGLPSAVEEILSFDAREPRRLAVISSESRIVVTEEDTVEAAAPLLVSYDTDGDGITDDIEERHGLDADDPNDKDDLDESKLAPIEEAILGGEPLGQPVAQGEVDGSLTVVLSDPAPVAQDEDASVTFAGVGEPNEVLALYVYSDVPVVVTVTTDENGQWAYKFRDALKDGEHEVYVSVNDDTGKVVRKSGPLSFFVREAVAASPEDYLRAASAASYVNAGESEVVRASKFWYVVGAVIITAAALLMGWAVMHQKTLE